MWSQIANFGLELASMLLTMRPVPSIELRTQTDIHVFQNVPTKNWIPVVRVAFFRSHAVLPISSNRGHRKGFGREGNQFVMGALHLHCAPDHCLLHELHAAAEESPGRARNRHFHLRRLVPIPHRGQDDDGGDDGC